MLTPRVRRSIRAVVSAIALIPVAAVAGPPPVVVVGGSAVGIPTLTPTMTIALGLLLIVVGMRFLKQHGGAQKVLSLLLMGGGLALGLVAVERPQASSFGFFEGSTACNGGQQSIGPGSAFADIDLENGCNATNLTIVAYDNYPCTAAEQIKSDADIGDTIRPGEFGRLNRCPVPD